MISLLIADESLLLVFQTKGAFCVNILVVLEVFSDVFWYVFWDVLSDNYKSLFKIINRILICNSYKTTFPYMMPIW